MISIVALLVIALLLSGCGAGAGSAEGADVSLFAVNVGKGDALILRVGDWVGLIDTGKAKAEIRIKAALAALNIDRLDGVFLTHTDSDHAGGLEWISESDIPVENWYASAMYTGVKKGKHPMVQAADLRDEEVQWLRRGDSLKLGDTGATLQVLAPISLYEDDEDDNSLVMMLESPQGRILLTGDMELPEEAELLAQGDDLKCDILKVGNHADSDSTGEAFVKAASAQIAVISTDSDEKPGTPDPEVVSRLEAAGSRVVVTQDSDLGLLVSLKDGTATLESLDIDMSLTTGLYIAEVDASDDIVVLGSRAAGNIDLSRFSLYSSRGKEVFAFPEGTSIAPGETLTIGTNSTDGDFDLLWDDKKVINKKKTDTIILYDNFGRALDSMDNGI